MDQLNTYGPQGPKHRLIEAALNLEPKKRKLLMAAISTLSLVIPKDELKVALSAITVCMAVDEQEHPAEYFSMQSVLMALFADEATLRQAQDDMEEALDNKGSADTLSVADLTKMFNAGDVQ